MSSTKEILQAIRDKNVKLVDRLTSNTDLNFYDPADNENTPLHEAVKVGSEEIVKMLIDKKLCNINALNKFNDTPLHLAATLPNPNIVKILISNGANIDLKNNRDKSAKDIAMEIGNPEITNLLLHQGCPKK